ncbi:MAG: TIGR04282 family arsenosugar biosynthesis glycosyltransferase [Methylococcales bacterium]|nr:TIGR04282 family arsenosugar biosynthesis glycosyltransferase [Methylococcales bacterium]
MSHYSFQHATLQIFCKAPVAGKVKTRLTPELTPKQAAIIHQYLSEKIIERLIEFKLCPLQLWCSPDIDHPFFQQLDAYYNLSLHTQSEGDLGLRMFNALESGLKHYTHTLLIGCDCPSFNRQDFMNAIEALEQGHDVVIAPTEDGGYSLIGLNQSQMGLFNDMTWGHSNVFETTLAKAKKLNLNVHLLKQQWDIDTPLDWKRYNNLYGVQAIDTNNFLKFN